MPSLFRVCIVLGVVAAAVIGVSPAAWAQDVVARVGGVDVTLADLDQAWHDNDASSRIRLLQQLYDTRRQMLDMVVGDRLIDREATARGLSRDELLAEELPSRTTPVTDAEVDLIYERNRDRFGGQTLEQMRPDLRMMMEQQRPMQALQQYRNELRVAATDVTVLLEAPRQEIAVLEIDPTKGPVDAPIEIVEFSDFQCPFCERATATLAQLVDRYGDQVRFVYKDYPLPNHENAFKAAEAGNCANEQGKFWELHDKMFATQSALGVASLKAYAEEFGMDAAAFSTCLDSGKYAGEVQRDLAVGQGYGVSSTPTIFINGRLVTGAVPFDVFDQIIREELAAAGR